MAGVARGYLVGYNLLQAVGWGAGLALLARDLAAGAGAGAALGFRGAPLGDAGSTFYVLQLLAGLEVAHAALGLVKGSPLNAVTQWWARANVLCAIVAPIPALHGSPAVLAMCVAWALGELCRYPWYALQLLGACPPALTYLRYTAFIPLYPVGVVGEVLAIVQALPHLKASGRYDVRLPNAGNVAFSYHRFMQFALLTYPFAWWSLYSHMFRQRRRKLKELEVPKPKAA